LQARGVLGMQQRGAGTITEGSRVQKHALVHVQRN
jgi:hypothetical protein